jgi:hypothetical protein
MIHVDRDGRVLDGVSKETVTLMGCIGWYGIFYDRMVAVARPYCHRIRLKSQRTVTVYISLKLSDIILFRGLPLLFNAIFGGSPRISFAFSLTH